MALPAQHSTGETLEDHGNKQYIAGQHLSKFPALKEVIQIQVGETWL